jgi:hypothetical protein
VFHEGKLGKNRKIALSEIHSFHPGAIVLSGTPSSTRTVKTKKRAFLPIFIVPKKGNFFAGKGT